MQNVSIIGSGCLNKCDGLFITGIFKEEFDKGQVKEILAKVELDYERYKLGGDQQQPSFIEGNVGLKET